MKKIKLAKISYFSRRFLEKSILVVVVVQIFNSWIESSRAKRFKIHKLKKLFLKKSI